MQAAILLPLLMVLMLAVVQAALWWHTDALVRTAANKGLDAARVENGTAADGHEAVIQFLRDPPTLSGDANIQVRRGAATASVTVSGDVVSVLFGVAIPVSVTVDAPVERILP